MDILELENVLTNRPFWFSALHDYSFKEDHIAHLGLYEEDMKHLRTLIPEEWSFVEKKRNPDNDFLRIDIVKI